jgi:hypothetical protein
VELLARDEGARILAVAALDAQLRIAGVRLPALRQFARGIELDALRVGVDALVEGLKSGVVPAASPRSSGAS